MNIINKVGLVILFCGISTQSISATQPVNLNDFYADPSVTVALDGLSATLEEDPGFGSVLLSNDPFFGGSGITVTPDLIGVSFDYTFSSPLGNDDQLYAWVFDSDAFAMIDEFFLASSGSGSVHWDLSSSLTGITTLGLEFQLNAFPADVELSSIVEISNVQLITRDTVTVPTPATLPLILVGLLGLLRVKRNQIIGE